MSQQSKLINGYMYFENAAFKIRYDVIKKYQKDSKIAPNFVDKYFDILDMKQGEHVLAQMPFLSETGRKQIYFVYNSLKYRPTRVVIMPILHERRIYLGR